jgi:REP element-mobilizing transposase RayT
MPRKNRIEKVGFYHIINRGVARESIYHDDEDFVRFLEITGEASDEYHFVIYSFCLMSNHYHILLQTSSSNLSTVMQKINSRYSIYYNNKYKRVGPLWQGRFKSWYVYDELYLKTLVKYIEYNPIKAGITKKIGEYKWAMSSKNVQCLMLHPRAFPVVNFELIESTNFDKELDESELEKIDELYRAKLEIKEEVVTKKELKRLDFYFGEFPKELAISKAIRDGYMGTNIAEYLGVTKASVSKIYTNYKQKTKLFEQLRDKGIFWSYSKDVTYEELGEKLLIEYVLKYADFSDIELCMELFGKRKVKNVWEEKLKSDRSFIKTNLMIARVFFDMDVESDYFKGVKNARLEKLRLLAS